MTTNLDNVLVYTTRPHRCSYLAGREATTLFIDPDREMDRESYSELSRMGFRRSGRHFYRPHCSGCNACIPARIPVHAFRPNRSQRRLWRCNSDLKVVASTSIDDDVCYDLYERYITARHSDGDMYPPDRHQYRSFLCAAWDFQRYYRFYDGDTLLAVAVCDELEDGLAAIYTFFDPRHSRRGLGSFAILWEIELTREIGLDHVYLGYWIRECRKMAYKEAFKPLELRIQGHWTSLGE